MKIDAIKEIGMRMLGQVGVAILAFIVGWGLGRVQNRDPILGFVRYTATPIQNESKNISMYVVYVFNSGNEEAENVDCLLKIPNARIVGHGINPTELGRDYKEKGDEAHIHIDMLNPNEAITVQLLAESGTPMPARPEVRVRGKGVNGVESGLPTASSQNPFADWMKLPFVIAFSFGMITILFKLINEISDFMERRWRLKNARCKLSVQFDSGDRIKITSYDIRGRPTDPIVMIPGSVTHKETGYSYDDFRQLGEGTFTVQKKSSVI